MITDQEESAWFIPIRGDTLRIALWGVAFGNPMVLQSRTAQRGSFRGVATLTKQHWP